jgi:glycosyltransferase involved in cell wall biosynthesis
MRVTVALHHLELGGSQLNALDLATRIRDRGHDVQVFATYRGMPGPVADLVRDRGLGLTLVEHPLERIRRAAPCRPEVAGALIRHARSSRTDVLHAYEYSQILDALHGPGLTLGTRVVGTIYGMDVPTWLPRSMPLIAGTRQLVDAARVIGQDASLIVPPVDTASDDPSAVGGGAFRRSLGIEDHEIAVVVVSRLEPDMKEDGIARAMTAVRELDDPRVRLVVVGDGPSFASLDAIAASANGALGRTAVIMAGSLLDPRPAYAAADIALGMGGSALRAMAFGAPLIVLGIRGFARPFDEGTADHFNTVGFYGIGSGEPDPLASHIAALLDGPNRRRLGPWSRRMVVDHYSLDAATDTLERIYRTTLDGRTGRRPLAALQTSAHRAVADLAGGAVRARLSPFVRGVLGRRAHGAPAQLRSA